MPVSHVIEKLMHGLMAGGRNPGPVGSPRGTGASRLPDPQVGERVFGNELYSWETGMFDCAGGAGIDL